MILWGMICGSIVVLFVFGYILKLVCVLSIWVFFVVIIRLAYMVVFRFLVMVMLLRVVIIGLGKLCSGFNMLLYR